MTGKVVGMTPLSLIFYSRQSTGALKPDEIVLSALKVFQEKLSFIHQEVCFLPSH